LVDADYLDTEAHFDSKAAKQRGSSIQVAQLWATLQEKQEKLLREAENTLVNQVRAEVYCACVEAAKLSPGVFRLVVPTGGGKTLSGLAFALHHAVQHSLERVIFSVPYTSIIEQTVEVYRSIFGDEAVLEHHSAAKSDFGNQEDQENAQRLKAQARLATQDWDAPLVVTTTVQLFESLFVNHPSRCRKLHNIVGSVIVLDEVQTLPVAVLNPILSVLRELAERYRVTIVLCTATQPALEAHSPYLQGFEAGSVRDIVSYEQARQYFSALSRVNYEIIPHPWSWKQLVLDVREHNHNQALIVLNTRKDALRVLDELQSETSFQSSKTPQIAVQETLAHSKVFHLSTLLCGAHRRQGKCQLWVLQWRHA
jgi:CRISPR-associated endonuclease/helicase Cas3